MHTIVHACKQTLTKVGDPRNLVVAQVECVQVLEVVQVLDDLNEVLMKKPTALDGRTNTSHDHTTVNCYCSGSTLACRH